MFAGVFVGGALGLLFCVVLLLGCVVCGCVLFVVFVWSVVWWFGVFCLVCVLWCGVCWCRVVLLLRAEVVLCVVLLRGMICSVML